MKNSSARRSFTRALPSHRLGKGHASLDSFRKASSFTASKQKEYTLIVVTDTKRRRILLGQKHRGFGKGMYNSFGGKVEPGEDISASAVRELHEEAGISVPLNVMSESRVGTLHFTFEDNDTEMVVHLFRVYVYFASNGESDPDVDPLTILIENDNVIRGCEEITPVWFEDWNEIPLDNMFADDTVWLTEILSSPDRISADGWFHFRAGGQETNSILHYHLDLRPKRDRLANGPANNDEALKRKQFSLEKRLFHALHDNKVHSPSIKEFNEAFAYVNAVRSVFGSSTMQKKNAFDYVIDVAGGHGALAALFLITTSATHATVVDPADVGGGGVVRAWRHFLGDKLLQYRYECLRTGLPAELDRALEMTTADRILVVACHACQHLSDEVLEICRSRGVHAAVMPCCQKDTSPGSSWKATSKRLGIPIEMTMDLLLAGKCMSWTTGEEASMLYDVRMKLIDKSITPQNRIIICRAYPEKLKEGRVAEAHHKLEVAYRRAHTPSKRRTSKSGHSVTNFRAMHFSSGLAIGFLLALLFLRR